MDEFKNEMIHITENDSLKKINKIKAKYNTLVVELDGINIQSWEDYIKVIEDKLSFPTTCIDNMNIYFDWIRDLSWFDYDAYVILIKNSCKFLISDIELRNSILSDFEDYIFPFWESEVEEIVAEGKRKYFSVFLVD